MTKKKVASSATRREGGKKVNKKGLSAKAVIGIGAGVAVLSAAAYVLFGPQGKKNRKVIHGWAVKMKGEIIEEFENAKELTESNYYDIIDRAQARYAKFKNVDKEELALLIKDIKRHWKAIKKDADSKKK
jgi:gas vesicle protein